MKSDFILSKLPPITDVPIVDFMDTLKHIDNEYNNNFPLWLSMVFTICSMLVASLLMALLIHLKCAKKMQSVLYTVWREKVRNNHSRDDAHDIHSYQPRCTHQSATGSRGKRNQPKGI